MTTYALLVEDGDPLNRESYLNINNIDGDYLDAEQKSELRDLSGTCDSGFALIYSYVCLVEARCCENHNKRALGAVLAAILDAEKTNVDPCRK